MKIFEVMFAQKNSRYVLDSVCFLSKREEVMPLPFGRSGVYNFHFEAWDLPTLPLGKLTMYACDGHLNPVKILQLKL